jgi:hypothetical protein
MNRSRNGSREIKISTTSKATDAGAVSHRRVLSRALNWLSRPWGLAHVRETNID